MFSSKMVRVVVFFSFMISFSSLAFATDLPESCVMEDIVRNAQYKKILADRCELDKKSPPSDEEVKRRAKADLEFFETLKKKKKGGSHSSFQLHITVEVEEE